MTIMSRATFILLAVLAVQASATTVTNCKTGAKDTKTAKISGCNEPPCTIKKGTTVNIDVNFTSPSVINELTSTAYAKFSFFKAPYSKLNGKSACDKIYHADNNAAATCPLKAGVKYVNKIVFYVEKTYPSGTFTVHYDLQTKSKVVVACIEFDVKLFE